MSALPTLRVAPEDLADAEARIRNRVEGEFLLTIVRRDGTRFRAEFCTRQCRLGDRPVRVVALRDVTERERTAALLRESEQRLQQILDSTFDCVVLSRDGTIVQAGSGVEDLLGRTAADMLGRAVIDFAVPEARPELLRRIQAQVTGTFESVIIGRDAESVPVEIISVMTTLNGVPVRAAGLRDLRAARRLEQERRRLELQVERSQRLESLGVLAGGIAHDFNSDEPASELDPKQRRRPGTVAWLVLQTRSPNDQEAAMLFRLFVTIGEAKIARASCDRNRQGDEERQRERALLRRLAQPYCAQLRSIPFHSDSYCLACAPRSEELTVEAFRS